MVHREEGFVDAAHPHTFRGVPRSEQEMHLADGIDMARSTIDFF